VATVDAYMFVRKVGNDGYFILRSSQDGQAAAVFFGLLSALTDGSASGEWDQSHARIRMSGRALSSILADIHGLDFLSWQRGHGISSPALDEMITDDAEYIVKAIQV
jgi:hypothetical protein